MNTIARLAVVATISLATLTASTSALASDGEHDHLLLAATGLELDVSTASGSWIATTEGRGSDASDLIELTSADGTLTRLVIGLAEDHNCRGLDRSLARRVAHRVHSADFMTIPGMYPEILATASGRMVFCIDTQRGPLMIAAAASAASAPRYGEFIGVVYRAARTTFAERTVTRAAAVRRAVTHRVAVRLLRTAVVLARRGLADGADARGLLHRLGLLGRRITGAREQRELLRPGRDADVGVHERHH